MNAAKGDVYCSSSMLVKTFWYSQYYGCSLFYWEWHGQKRRLTCLGSQSDSFGFFFPRCHDDFTPVLLCFAELVCSHEQEAGRLLISYWSEVFHFTTVKLLLASLSCSLWANARTQKCHRIYTVGVIPHISGPIRVFGTILQINKQGCFWKYSSCTQLLYRYNKVPWFVR